MSEYWKSTPRYWCKYCAVYVRDTKLERANHESTARHQGAIKRSLRDLHRSHDRDERDKERAKREIDRLNGVVPGGNASSSGTPAPLTSTSSSTHTLGSSRPAPPPTATEASLKKQREQLAELGVAIPSSFRPEMAMPGEWTVTSTRVVETRRGGGNDSGAVEARASGVRKREENEEEKEEEEAVRGLFKKAKRWGRDSKGMPDDQDAELDALLSGSLVKKQSLAEDDVKEAGEEEEEEEEEKKVEEKTEDGIDVKLEPAVKEEPDTAAGCITATATKLEDADSAVGAVVFKKRKPKGLRTK
ncbi:hypothetical protein BBAD15_g1795 [Beauveria bassiana D1-5]|uniref:U1-C C2H2-type zinc finger domain-containing protein n=1 Tax=Beauveria bassiana D1-5 TaxID=1245745 RepID=A0A0A2W1Z0_BEABA|nr:hypothetical protein BBAD15_g1795 [Beauveria bassiana D1-5]